MNSTEILLIIIVCAVLLRIVCFGRFSQQKGKGFGG